MRDYYVLMVKKATGHPKYLVVFHDVFTGCLVIWNKWDDETAALLDVERLNKEA